jgi:hypothetical protein
VGDTDCRTAYDHHATEDAEDQRQDIQSVFVQRVASEGNGEVRFLPWSVSRSYFWCQHAALFLPAAILNGVGNTS